MQPPYLLRKNNTLISVQLKLWKQYASERELYELVWRRSPDVVRCLSILSPRLFSNLET